MATSPPAFAHPLDVDLPPNYDSRVTGLEGHHRGVSVRVAGGDALVVLEVPEGVVVEVPGYNPPEEYLRFDAAGGVHANIAGPTHHYNNAKGSIDLRLRPDLRADAEPSWRLVSSDGRYAWRDARISWMGPDPTPPQIDTDRAQHVRDWQIPILVDGEPVMIAGTLHWVPTPSPALPVTLALLVAAAAIARRSPVVSAAALGVGAASVAVLTVAEMGAPTDTPVTHVAALPAAVVALLLAARSTARATPAPTRAKALLVAAVGLGVAVVPNLGVITTAVLPGWLPSLVARPLLGVAAGAVLAGVVTGVLTWLRPGDGTKAGPGAHGDRAKVSPTADGRDHHVRGETATTRFGGPGDEP